MARGPVTVPGALRWTLAWFEMCMPQEKMVLLIVVLQAPQNISKCYIKGVQGRHAVAARVVNNTHREAGKGQREAVLLLQFAGFLLRANQVRSEHRRTSRYLKDHGESLN